MACGCDKGNAMIFLIGGNGFVGSAYARLFQRLDLEYRIIRREDHAALAGASCDVLINANGNSKKFLADQDPLGDFDASVRTVLHALTNFRYRYYVQLSTGDVYPDQSSPAVTQEDGTITPARLSRYGLHKYLAEQLVQQYAAQWLIVRMGGFVGPGLKKNAIFDMLNDAPVWLAPDSELQFIHTDTAAELVWDLIQRNINGQIVNLGARGVLRLQELHQFMQSGSDFRPDARKVRFELNLDRLEKLVDRELPTTEQQVRQYVQEWRQTRMLNLQTGAL